ncbi:MAG: chemotaxis protein CheW [Granulosicoccus sp.]
MNASGAYVLFEAGGEPLAATAAAIDAIHDELPIQEIEGTKRWFLGLAVANGRLLPTTDLGLLLGKRASSGRILQLHSDVGIAGLRVDTVYGLRDSVTCETLAGDGDDAHPAISSQVVRDEGRLHRVLDFVALLQSPEFVDIALDATESIARPICLD